MAPDPIEQGVRGQPNAPDPICVVCGAWSGVQEAETMAWVCPVHAFGRELASQTCPHCDFTRVPNKTGVGMDFHIDDAHPELVEWVPADQFFMQVTTEETDG